MNYKIGGVSVPATEKSPEEVTEFYKKFSTHVEFHGGRFEPWAPNADEKGYTGQESKTYSNYFEALNHWLEFSESFDGATDLSMRYSCDGVFVEFDASRDTLLAVKARWEAAHDSQRAEYQARKDAEDRAEYARQEALRAAQAADEIAGFNRPVPDDIEAISIGKALDADCPIYAVKESDGLYHVHSWARGYFGSHKGYKSKTTARSPRELRALMSR